MNNRQQFFAWLTSWQLWHAVFQIGLAVAPQMATVFKDSPKAIMALQVFSALCAASELYLKPQVKAENIITVAEPELPKCQAEK